MDPGKPDKKQVRVTILNQSYTLRATGSEAETQELAQVVDDLMTGIARRSASLDSTRVAVLACLHLADRLRSLEYDLEELRRRVSEKSRDFSLLLDQALNSD